MFYERASIPLDISQVIWPNGDLNLKIDPSNDGYLIYDGHIIRKCLNNFLKGS